MGLDMAVCPNFECPASLGYVTLVTRPCDPCFPKIIFVLNRSLIVSKLFSRLRRLGLMPDSVFFYGYIEPLDVHINLHDYFCFKVKRLVLYGNA